MAFHAPSAGIGAAIVIVLLLIWKFLTGRRSFYMALPDFQDNMTPEAGKALYDATFKSLSDDLDAKVKEAKALNNPDKELLVWKDGRNVLNEFSNKYDEFLLKKQKTMPRENILHPNDAPAAQEAPAAPAAQEAPAVQTSTFKPEAYY